MTEFLFPDNTVLCNFAAVNRLNLLRMVLDGRGRWTEAIEYEARMSARVLPSLGQLDTDRWLGQPIEIADESDIKQIELIRRAVFGGTDAKPLKHLGEAQTCFVILKWSEFAGSWWISDDREALRYAHRQGITTRETIDLVSLAVVNGHIEAQEAFKAMQQMADQDRHLRLPDSAAELL
jgi:predicted nucleic acid-binding protein